MADLVIRPVANGYIVREEVDMGLQNTTYVALDVQGLLIVIEKTLENKNATV